MENKSEMSVKLRRFNWQVWVGFFLSVAAFVSYPFVFVKFPVTRDFPWANLLLFIVAAAFLWIGLRRAFSPERRTRSKVAGSVLAILSLLVLGFFVFSIFIVARQLPPSHAAPQIGQKAPDFTLVDVHDKPVSLAELLSTPINGSSSKPKGVLLVFYRGYW